MRGLVPYGWQENVQSAPGGESFADYTIELACLRCVHLRERSRQRVVPSRILHDLLLDHRSHHRDAQCTDS